MRRLLPAPLAVLVAFAIALPVFVSQTSPVQAGSCTGWESRKRPPETIRVLRTKTGVVEKVNFYQYVAIVMASGEWPTWMPYESLEVGAVAVKQYAWYYALKGHHRSWYVTKDGVCYDVRDDTNDQLYKPEWDGEPTNKQYKAMDATWLLSLRKNNRFFLTGYRAGANNRCGEDRDGWRLYQDSVMDCADRLGMTRHEIQLLYYKPRIKFIWADGAAETDAGPAPTVTLPRPSFARKSTFGSASSAVRWSGSDEDGTIVRYRLQHSVNGGRWRDVDLASPTATSIRLPLSRDDAHRFRVRAKDDRGNWSAWRTGPTFRRVTHQDGSSRITYEGDWTTVDSRRASRGTLASSDVVGSRASFTFTGRSVALVAPRGPGRGNVEIFLDGQLVATVDLSADRLRARRVVFVSDFKRIGTHTIVARVAGGAAGNRVDIDAVAVQQ